MGKNLKRIYQNDTNGGYCIEEVAKLFSDIYTFSETNFFYDEETKEVYHKETLSSELSIYKSKTGKVYRFDSTKMIESD